MYDATLMTVLNCIAKLSEPETSLFLGNALLFPDSAEQVAAGRLLHYEIHPSVRLDRLLIHHCKLL